MSTQIEHRINALQQNVTRTIMDCNKGFEYLEELLLQKDSKDGSVRNTSGDPCLYSETGDIVIGRIKDTEVESRILIGYCAQEFVQDDTTESHDSEDVIRIGVDEYVLSTQLPLKSGSIAIGKNASLIENLDPNVIGNDTIAIGSFALEQTSNAGNTIAIGHGASRTLAEIGAIRSNDIIIGNGAAESAYLDGETTIIGYQAAQSASVNQDAIIIGKEACGGCPRVKYNSISIGSKACASADQIGENSINIGAKVLGDGGNQSAGGAVVMGYETLYKGTQGESAIAIGPRVLQYATQSDGAIALGGNTLLAFNTGGSVQGANAIALGPDVLKYANQGDRAIAIGSRTCSSNHSATAVTRQAGQGASAIAIGHETSKGSIQGENAIALGYRVLASENGSNGRQGIGAIAIGSNIATEQDAFQQARAITIGVSSNIKQKADAVALGWYPHHNSIQGEGGISIGRDAGNNTGNGSTVNEGGILIGRDVCRNVSKIESGIIAIGSRACVSDTNPRYHGHNKISIGTEATSYATTYADAIAIGNHTITWGSQQKDAIAIGAWAGVNVDQSEGAILIGHDAFTSSVWYAPKQESMALAIGNKVGSWSLADKGIVQKLGALAIGTNAISNGDQGVSSIAIGTNAGVGGQHNNSIVISALGTDFTSSREGGLFIKPIRTLSTVDGVLATMPGANMVKVMYNQESGELFTISKANEPVIRTVDEVRTGSADFHADGLIVKGDVNGIVKVYGQLDGTKIGRGGLIMTNRIGLKTPKVVPSSGQNVKRLVIDMNSGEIKYRN